MHSNRHTKTAVVVVLLFGLVLFYWGTDGYTAFTAETARVKQLMEENPLFPDVTLEDSRGETYPFSTFRDRYVFITFMYTNCKTVCLMLETNMARVYELIPEKHFEDDIVFLSISFDPDHDDPPVLDQYKDLFGSDGIRWRMARIPDQEELNLVLESFGVIVIPDGQGNFAHNSAFYLVDRQGRLIKVMDFMDPEGASETIIDILTAEKG
ncbi:electron transport protein SCO1/SenC [Caldalkalibacillus thermarum TA2.A1]|uniref:Electron transport protein SCO1/SenC n=1 Tax=Caldalkalibacillus thermarum (strain TA2.A1) TaxID=986075 RepID=F5L5U4_CALTT|nr:SCO family protein [Caldalkalibacillus thermarum]EGL83299.1 electron transport protein SCO1/SenC [Caldalkalibacillus thermarum TA2.A1]QZT33214.1 SCO family protein [Caldalkalibacillus thermarum TA2.A1]